MATADQIAKVRLLTAESTTETYSDVTLGARIDSAVGDLNLVSRDIWEEKAASFAELVNTSEAGSSRSNGQLHQQALAMVAHFSGMMTSASDSAGSRTIVSKLRRS